MIGVDCEGVACVVGKQGAALGEGKHYEWACRQATREADAAAKGLFDAGATEVVVWDNHGSGVNLIYEDIDSRCQFAVGAGSERRWPGLDSSFAGVAMIGYHAMDNTTDAVLAHSFSSATYQYLKVNGTEVGEIAIDAANAGELGVPLIFVASDDHGVAEARRFMPWVQTVATKRGLGWNVTLSKHPLEAAAEIRQGLSAAVAGLKQMKPFTFASPLEVEIRYKRLESAEQKARDHNGWKRVEPYVCRKMLAKISDFI
jgi:D-amino peptidase